MSLGRMGRGVADCAARAGSVCRIVASAGLGVSEICAAARRFASTDLPRSCAPSRPCEAAGFRGGTSCPSSAGGKGKPRRAMLNPGLYLGALRTPADTLAHHAASRRSAIAGHSVMMTAHGDHVYSRPSLLAGVSPSRRRWFLNHVSLSGGRPS